MHALLVAAAGLQLEHDNARPLLQARDADFGVWTLRLPRPCQNRHRQALCVSARHLPQGLLAMIRVHMAHHEYEGQDDSSCAHLDTCP